MPDSYIRKYVCVCGKPSLSTVRQQYSSPPNSRRRSSSGSLQDLNHKSWQSVLWYSVYVSFIVLIKLFHRSSRFVVSHCFNTPLCSTLSPRFHPPLCLSFPVSVSLWVAYYATARCFQYMYNEIAKSENLYDSVYHFAKTVLCGCGGAMPSGLVWKKVKALSQKGCPL